MSDDKDTTGNNENEDNDPEIGQQYRSLDETASLLKISTGKLRKWANEGLIDAFRPTGKFGRLWFTPKAIGRFIEKHIIGRQNKDE